MHLLFNFAATPWVWTFQFRFSLILTPRYSIDLEGWSLFLLSLIFIGHSSFLFLCLKISSSVFLTSSKILLAFSQLVKFFRSILIYLLSLFTDLLKWTKLLSSVKWRNFQNFIAWLTLTRLGFLKAVFSGGGVNLILSSYS